MKDLIPISEHNGKKAVSARQLHAFLESKQDFSTWIKNRIEKYGLIKNQDYVSFHKIVERETGGSTRTEYALSIDCAKELSMVEGNERGKQARQYFIACEKKLKEQAKPLTPAEQLLENARLLVEQERRLAEVEDKVQVLEAKAQTHPSYFTVMGYASLHRISVNLRQAAAIGKRAADLCKMLGFPMDRTPDPRFGEVNMYPEEVLRDMFDRQSLKN